MSQTESLDLVNEGAAAARAGEKEHARSLFLEAVALDPDGDSARLWLASIADSPLEALEHLDHILARDPEHEKALPAARAARVRAGVAAAKAKDGPLARSLLRQAVAEDPECEKAWVWLAGVAETPEEAVAALEQALEINPDNERTRTALEAYRGSGHAAEPEPEPEPEPELEPIPAVAPSVASASRRRKILVVDDSAMVRKLVGYALEQHGYAVRSAEDGSEAIAALRLEGLPDAILLDVSLPDQDGYQLCKLLHQEPKTAHIPVVMLAEQTGFVNSMRGRLAGAYDVIVKSLELDGLLDAVDQLFEE